MSLQLCDGDPRRVHFAYLSMAPGPSASVPAEFSTYLELDTCSTDPAHVGAACDPVHRQRIVERHSLQIQQQRLADIVRAVCAGQQPILS